jgi:hypothetical protein
MMGIDVSIWNGIAPFARSAVWRRLFSLNADAQNNERDRLYAALLDRGLTHSVASGFLTVAPLLHECVAIDAYKARHPEWSRVLLEVLSVDEALHIVEAEANFALEPAERLQLSRLLRKDPEAVLPPVPADQQEIAWHDEATSMLTLTAGDWAVADAAEMPEALVNAITEAEFDDDFDDDYEEWYTWATSDPLIVIGLEQCCEDGMPLPERERTMKLASAPECLRLQIDAFWHQCPERVALQLACKVYWMARSERGRRRGCAEWSPEYPLPPWWEEQAPIETFDRWCERPK